VTFVVDVLQSFGAGSGVVTKHAAHCRGHVVIPSFFTPRIDMQKCSASMTTIGRAVVVPFHGLDDLSGHTLLH